MPRGKRTYRVEAVYANGEKKVLQFTARAYMSAWRWSVNWALKSGGLLRELKVYEVINVEEMIDGTR